jgi:predicted transcriptional regulator
VPDIEWIKAAIKRRKVIDLSAATGLSAPTIRDVRDGKGNPTLKTIDTLSRYLMETGE